MADDRFRRRSDFPRRAQFLLGAIPAHFPRIKGTFVPDGTNWAVIKPPLKIRAAQAVLPVLDSVTKIPRDQYMRAQQGGAKHLY